MMVLFVCSLHVAPFRKGFGRVVGRRVGWLNSGPPRRPLPLSLPREKNRTGIAPEKKTTSGSLGWIAVCVYRRQVRRRFV